MASIITNLSLGGSGGINFVADASAEAGLGAWKTYNDGASVAQTGAGNLVVSGLTIGLNTTSALRGTQSYIATKSAANCQGMGWAYDFTIDSNDQGRVVALTFDYLIAGTFNYGLSTSDVQMYIYDKVNGTMQQFAPNYFTGPKDKWRGIFQAAYNSTQYRLVFHVATTNTSAWTFTYDNVKCGPQMESGSNQGSIVTDWQDYPNGGSLQVSGANSAPTFGGVQINTAKWRRVGDSMEIRWSFWQNSAGTAGSGIYLIPTPAGYSIDVSKVKARSGAGPTDIGAVGVAQLDNGGGSNGIATVEVWNANAMVLRGNYNTGTSSSTTFDWNDTTFHLGQSLEVTFQASVPILGWSSGGIVMQQDTDTRVVAFVGQYGSGQSLSPTGNAAIVLNYNSQVDTHGGYNSSTNTYTIQVPGIYEIFASVRAAQGDAGDRYLEVNLNGVDEFLDIVNFSGNIMTKGSRLYNLKAGDQVKIRWLYGSGSTTSSIQAGIGTFSVKRLSGPSAIAATESINAKYYTSVTGTANSTVPFNFDSKVYDSHGAATTGTNWRYTAPVQGKYSIKLFFNNSSALSGPVYFMVYKNGSIYQMFGTAQVSYPYGQCSVTIPMNAGEYFDIRTNNSSYAWSSGGIGSGSAYPCTLDIERIGN